MYSPSSRIALLSALALPVASLSAQTPPDVTAQIVNVGTLDGGTTYNGVNDIINWRGRLLFPGGSDNDTVQRIPIYTVAGGLAREKNAAGSDIIVRQEKINRGFIVDGELILSGEDGFPNNISGITLARTGGWGLRAVDENRYDAGHLSGQIKYRGRYFASYGENSSFPNNIKGACVLVSSDGLETWHDVGDPLGVLATPPEYPGATRKTRGFIELGGELYAMSSMNYKAPGALFGSFVPKHWMLRYTGRPDHAFEVGYDDPVSLHSALGRYGVAPLVYATGELRNGKALILVNDQLIRVRFENATSVTGDIYPRPVGEAEVFAENVRDLHVAHGVAYVLRGDNTTDAYSIHASTDGINWTTLCTFQGPIGGAFGGPGQIAVLNNELYVADLKVLLRIPSTVVSLPQNNAAPAALADAYANGDEHAIKVLDSRQGLLANDTDADRDPLYAELVSSPANGTLTLNPDGTFWYYPNAGFAGTDSFTYRATDGKDVSGVATVSLTFAAPRSYTLDNADPQGVAFAGSWTIDASPQDNIRFWSINFRHDNNGGKGSATARFTPRLRESGIYEVLVRQPTHTQAGYNYFNAAAASATNVPVTIVHAAGAGAPTQLALNQAAGANQWQSLGSYAFNAGEGGYLELSNTGTTAAVSADAVRFIYRDAPSSVAGSASDWRTIQLSWVDNNLDETGFEVERSPDGGANWWLAATLPADTTSFTDTPLAGGTAYTYRVRGIRAGGPTSWSDVATVSTMPLYHLAPQADAGVDGGSPTSNSGASKQLSIEAKGGSTNRKGYFRYQLPDRAALGWTGFSGAQALFTTSTRTSTAATFTLWGLRDDHAGDAADGWSESTLNSDNAPGNVATNSSFSTSVATSLASASVTNTADLRFTLSHANLDTFLNADTNRFVTVMLVRSGATSGSSNNGVWTRDTDLSESVERRPRLVVPPANTPPAPAAAQLSAVRDDSGAYALRWRDVPDVSSLLLQRSTDGVTWTTLATRSAHAGVFTDSSAPTSGDVFYRLVSQNPRGDSPGSTPAGRSFDNWRLVRFAGASTVTLGQSGRAWSPNSDDDGDGLPLAVEYALGTDPATPERDEFAPVVAPEGGALRVEFTRSRHTADVPLVFEWSTDLVTWRTDEITWTTLAQDALSEHMRAEVPTAGRPRVFVRLRATP